MLKKQGFIISYLWLSKKIPHIPTKAKPSFREVNLPCKTRDAFSKYRVAISKSFLFILVAAMGKCKQINDSN